MKHEVEFRVRRKLAVGGTADKEWQDIEPITLMLEDTEISGMVDLLTIPSTVEVRWNYGGCPAGIGQGHYSIGPAHPYYS